MIIPEDTNATSAFISSVYYLLGDKFTVKC